MRLSKYKVNKFRSVKETEWIEIDQLACFVGVNESGKTNLLLPLWKFNPADDATKIDLLLDYPRDEYFEVEANGEIRKKEPFIEVLFKLNETELKSFSKKYEKYLAQSSGEDDQAEAGAEVAGRIVFTDYLLIKKNYNEDFYIYLSNDKGELLSEELEDVVWKDIFNVICEAMPRFVYYSEYGNLDSDLYLPRVIDDLGRIDALTGKERMKARTLKVLFGHLKLDPKEILDLGRETVPNNDPRQKAQPQIEKESRNKQERFAKVTSAASRLTAQFKAWWTQGDYIFHFNADGEYFRILVSDIERPAPIELESRSKGLQWFFSFFLVFLSESEENHKDCVLLLDEPGLSLHPNAQTDLIRFFERLADKNQLIYTTHLPFLVDHNNLDKVKAVYTEKGMTKASNDISRADKEKKAIQPVNAAIGITASQSLLVGCDIIIVEGVSDQFYLTMIKNHLVAKGKLQPKKEMVFIPVGGAKAVRPVVSIIQGGRSSLPVALLDSDKTGKQFQESLKQSLYKSAQGKVLDCDTFSHKIGSEIEDLIPLGLLVDSFDRIFRTEDGLQEDAIDPGKPVIPQFEDFARDNQLSLDLGWKVELSKRIKHKFDGNVDDALEEQWINLFKAFEQS